MSLSLSEALYSVLAENNTQSKSDAINGTLTGNYENHYNNNNNNTLDSTSSYAFDKSYLLSPRPYVQIIALPLIGWMTSKIGYR